MLKLVLKPNEKIIVGTAVITGAETGKTEITIHNDVPILRQKDVMTVETANTPSKVAYLLIQMMYVDPDNIEKYQTDFFDHVGELMKAAPSMYPFIIAIQQHLVAGQYYKAIRECQKLIEYEGELLNV
jgi:flagellar protein FlbT